MIKWWLWFSFPISFCIQTTHVWHNKHQNQCPDPDSCQWHTKSSYGGKNFCNLPTYADSHTWLVLHTIAYAQAKQHLFPFQEHFLSPRFKLADMTTQLGSLCGCNDALFAKIVWLILMIKAMKGYYRHFMFPFTGILWKTKTNPFPFRKQPHSSMTNEACWEGPFMFFHWINEQI